MSLSNSMVAHRWAHGNSGKGSNFCTDGKRLISYSTDVAYNTGRGLVFISDDSMSPTTGKQLSHARRACSHLDVIYTPIFKYGSRLHGFDEKRAFSLACEALNIQLEGYSKARLGKYLHSSIVRTIENCARMVALAERYSFACPVFSEIPADKLEAARLYSEQADARDAARREVARVKAHAAAAARREAQALQFTAWRSGFQAGCPDSYRTDENGGYYIAVRGDKVVTSGGAECPVEHARRAIEFWCSREVFEETEGRVFNAWHRNGHTVQLGTFQLDRIEQDGTAYAGCHKFSVAELDRLADLLL